MDQSRPPAPTSSTAFWTNAPREGWTQRCIDQFNEQLKAQLSGKLPSQPTAARRKLANFKSASSALAKAGVRRRGFGIAS